MDFIPSLPTLLAFSAASLLLAMTPGPDMTLSISRALAQGKKAALFRRTRHHARCCRPYLPRGLRHLRADHGFAGRLYRPEDRGAAYLLWLAIQAIRFGSSLSVKKVDTVGGTPLANISNGFWVNLLNPKVIIFFMTFLPQFVTAGDPAVTHKLLFLGFFFIVIGMPVNMLVVLAADGLSSWLQRNRGVMRGLDYAFAGVFSIFAVKIFFTQAR